MTHKLHTITLIFLTTYASSTQAAEAPNYEAGIQKLCGNLPQDKQVVQAAKQGNVDMAAFYLLAESKIQNPAYGNGRKTLRTAKRAMQQRAGQDVADFIFDDPLAQPK